MAQVGNAFSIWS